MLAEGDESLEIFVPLLIALEQLYARWEHKGVSLQHLVDCPSLLIPEISLGENELVDSLAVRRVCHCLCWRCKPLAFTLELILIPEWIAASLVRQGFLRSDLNWSAFPARVVTHKFLVGLESTSLAFVQLLLSAALLSSLVSTQGTDRDVLLILLQARPLAGLGGCLLGPRGLLRKLGELAVPLGQFEFLLGLGLFLAIFALKHWNSLDIGASFAVRGR